MDLKTLPCYPTTGVCRKFTIETALILSLRPKWFLPEKDVVINDDMNGFSFLDKKQNRGFSFFCDRREKNATFRRKLHKNDWSILTGG